MPLPPPDVYCCPKSEDVWAAILKGTGGTRRWAPTDAYNPDRPAIIGGLDFGSDGLLAAAMQTARMPFFFVDRAYFNGGRGSGRFRVIRNAYHMTYVMGCPTDRFEATGIRLRPWKGAGRHIFVCPSSLKHHRFFGRPNWIEETVERIRRHTDRPVIVKHKDDGPTLAHLLKYHDPHAVVTYGSNAAVEALCWGVPAYTEIGGARPLSFRSIDDIERPYGKGRAAPTDSDRLGWASWLAYQDFTVEELADGTMWRAMHERI